MTDSKTILFAQMQGEIDSQLKWSFTIDGHIEDLTDIATEYMTGKSEPVDKISTKKKN